MIDTTSPQKHVRQHGLRYMQYHIKKDILQRKNYLVSKLVTSPKNIIDCMPKIIGSQFQGEWALYSCSMFAQALCNIAKMYPETREHNKCIIHELIIEVLSEDMKRYDIEKWDMEDPIESLKHNTEIRHLSYRSHLAWMICNYKLVGGDCEFDSLLHEICSTFAKGISSSPAMNLPTYSDMCVYLPDMLVAIVALHFYNKIFKGKFVTTENNWLYKAKHDMIDRKTGLLYSVMSYEGRGLGAVRGSYSALNTYYLSLIDYFFAKKQYSCLKKSFLSTGIITGCKEYLQDTRKLITFDVDAGPIILGLSPSGTAFLTGCATAFGDFYLRKKLLVTANLAGISVSHNNKKHYLLSMVAPVGEAIMLAMKTECCL